MSKDLTVKSQEIAAQLVQVLDGYKNTVPSSIIYSTSLGEPISIDLSTQRGTKKVAINTEIGGFKSDSVCLMVFSPDNKYILSSFPSDEERSHPLLIECIETLGKEASSNGTNNTKIVEIPADVDYYIAEEHCGIECVAKKHRTWK